MGEEDDLDRIFQEKLFIRRRVPDTHGEEIDKENLDGGRADGLLIGRIGSRPLADVPLNTPKRSRTKIFGDGRMAEPSLCLDVPRETSLDGIYQSTEGAGEHCTDDKDTGGGPRQSCAPLDKGATEEPMEGGCAEKKRPIEEEFDRFRAAQLESLRLKSKIYRFIHSEIYKIDLKYASRVRLLEEENRQLRNTVEKMDRRFAKYQEFVSSNVLKLKSNVIAAMKEYKKRYAKSG